MFFSDLKKLDKQYIAGTYRRYDLGAEKGEGAVCTDVAGDRLIDFSAGIGVNSLGFCSPKWVAAVQEQAAKLQHISNLYYTEPAVELAKALCERTRMQKVFFSNSGAEANECAIKTARKYSADHYSKERCEIITLENSFHGRTITTLAATGQDAFHQNFGPFPAGFVYAKPNDIADLNAKISDKTCAVMIETIQGEGGVLPLEEDYIKTVASLCFERDILLIVDEVQTGAGRTGHFMSYRHFKIRPDIVTLAKGLGGGLPIGATLFSEKVRDTLGAGDHGSTFGGNPVCCAGALAIMQELDGRFMDSVTDKGAYFAQQLGAIDGITGVTGRGLMLGAAIAPPRKAAEIAAACLKEGLILLTAKDKLRFLPPLNISKTEIDQGLAILKRVLAEKKGES